jgi:Secretion system C-terminal sorting domain
MKRFILLIISVFVISFSFANNNVKLSDLEENISQIDTSLINFYDLQTIKLYPNPASNHIIIDYEIIYVKEAKLQIYNSIGSVVFSKELKNNHDKIKISVTDYKNGLYFCSLKIDGKLLNTRKIIVNH